METITKNTLRIGNFTSSEIHRLTGSGKSKDSFGKVFETYVKEKNYERKLGRSLSTESGAKPLTWGKFCEFRAFNLLGTEYILNSQETDLHPTIKFWSGSCDGIKSDGKTVIEIKCPFTLKAFCELIECETGEDVKTNFPEYYWQILSNAIIKGCDKAELIVYVPYLSELEEIREETGGIDTLQKQFAWINFSENEELPYIVDGGYYKNINIIKFDINKDDVDFLTQRVIEAGKLLINE